MLNGKLKPHLFLGGLFLIFFSNSQIDVISSVIGWILSIWTTLRNKVFFWTIKIVMRKWFYRWEKNKKCVNSNDKKNTLNILIRVSNNESEAAKYCPKKVTIRTRWNITIPRFYCLLISRNIHYTCSNFRICQKFANLQKLNFLLQNPVI